MATELEKWVNESPENRQYYAQEGLILSVTEEIWAAMERRGINKQQLAERLGTGKSHVSQLLTGARNMTLRSLSDIAGALEQHVELIFINKEDDEAWRPINGGALKPLRQSVTTMTGDYAANDKWTNVAELRA